MDDVAAACGITKLIVYRHFETKEELYRAILQRVFDRLAQEFSSNFAAPSTRGIGARTQLTVAREDPDGYRLLWRHAAREPKFAAYAAEVRRTSVQVVRELIAVDTGDPRVDRWQAETIFSWLLDATLAWLDEGDAAQDDVFVERVTAALQAIHQAWATPSASA
jgi:AcrR family transcriptional regulator